MKITRRQLRRIIESSLDEIGLFSSILGHTQDRYEPRFDTDRERYQRGEWAAWDDDGEDYGDFDEKNIYDDDGEDDDLLQELGIYPDDTTSHDGRMFDYGSSKSDSHEGRMTKAKLFRIAQMSQSLESKLQDGDDLPGWVQDKVTTAEDRLRSAYDYMDYKIRRMKQRGEHLTESKVRKDIRKYLLNT